MVPDPFSFYKDWKSKFLKIIKNVSLSRRLFMNLQNTSYDVMEFIFVTWNKHLLFQVILLCLLESAIRSVTKSCSIRLRKSFRAVSYVHRNIRCEEWPVNHVIIQRYAFAFSAQANKSILGIFSKSLHSLNSFLQQQKISLSILIMFSVSQKNWRKLKFLPSLWFQKNIWLHLRDAITVITEKSRKSYFFQSI